MSFLTGGGGKKQKAPAPIAAAPQEVSKEATAAKQNVRERLQRQKGRAASQVTVPGLLEEVNPNLARPGLRDKFGG